MQIYILHIVVATHVLCPKGRIDNVSEQAGISQDKNLTQRKRNI